MLANLYQKVTLARDGSDSLSSYIIISYHHNGCCTVCNARVKCSVSHLYHCCLKRCSLLVRTLKNVRALALTDQGWARSNKPADDEVDKPIKFSTSKASHRTWNVERSLGSQEQRPWWKVLPISLATFGFLLWCTFRSQSEVDEQLEKQLYEQLPGLLSDEENDVSSKSS